jgi:hypothetical protein
MGALLLVFTGLAGSLATFFVMASSGWAAALLAAPLGGSASAMIMAAFVVYRPFSPRHRWRHNSDAFHDAPVALVTGSDAGPSRGYDAGERGPTGV